jgi:hypothetical protein
MKYSIAVLIACSAGIMIVASPAFAQTDSASASSTMPVVSGTVPSCAPDPSAIAAEIQTIQNNPTLSSLDEIKTELAVRRSFLSNTILCAQTDVQSLQTELASTTVDTSLANIEAGLSGQLNDASNYYNLQLTKVNGAGISGTEAIAKDILNWRTSNYAPLAQNVSNFILWSQNQAIFATAHNRLNQVGSIVTALPFSENTELQTDFQEATVSLENAEQLNAQAKAAFAQSLQPDQSLALIQQSLAALGVTYQHFFDISNLVQTLLPQ